MSEAVERLVNLALYLAAAREPVTSRDVREQVEGYPSDQDDEAFLRMFERDKRELRASGLVIGTVELSGGRAYELDTAATFARPVDLSAEETALLRAVGATFLADDSFPFTEALATAMAKLSVPTACGAGRSRLADEQVVHQAAAVRTLSRACVTRKRAAFAYERAGGRAGQRTVDPYGLFLREGRWYLVALDHAAGEVRTFAVRRMSDVAVERGRPGTPDFHRPDGFDAADHARLPFQYGEEPFDAVLEFEPDLAWRASLLSEGRGYVEPLPDGGTRWTVEARDAARLARWVIEHGPGVSLAGPPPAVEALRTGLERVGDRA